MKTYVVNGRVQVLIIQVTTDSQHSILSQSSNATLFYSYNECSMPIGSPKRMFIQLGNETYFSFNNMP